MRFAESKIRKPGSRNAVKIQFRSLHQILKKSYRINLRDLHWCKSFRNREMEAQD